MCFPNKQGQETGVGKLFAGDHTTSSFKSKTQEKGRVFCSGQHSSHRCLVVQSPLERKKRLMQNGRWFKCLFSAHLSRVCKMGRGCFESGQKHHQAVCLKTCQRQEQRGTLQARNKTWKTVHIRREPRTNFEQRRFEGQQS